jgi:transcriptional regulator with XRE-family HTH domain
MTIQFDENTTAIKLGEKIEKIRKEQRGSQEGIALEAGVERSYMGKIERGEANPTLSVLVKIAKGLKTTLSNLFDEETK